MRVGLDRSWAALGLGCWAAVLGFYGMPGKFLFFAFFVLILYFVFPIFEFYFICYFVLHILACLNSIRMYLVIMYTLVVLIKYFL
jgi:hypothetical protein